MPYVECEPVADRPEIEICIVSPPRQTPQLAEVVFPGSMSIREAKEYIYREMEELSIEVDGSTVTWVESSTGPSLWLSDRSGVSPLPLGEGSGVRADPRQNLTPSPQPLSPFGGEGLGRAPISSSEDKKLPDDTVAVSLCQGVTEQVGSHSSLERLPSQTVRLDFDRSVGWDLTKAAHWVEKHLHLHPLGRTVQLNRPHRMCRELARVLASILSEDEGADADAATAFEFITVPSLPVDEPRRSSDGESQLRNGGVATAVKPRIARGGAGLEIDLSDPRRPDAMPSELRALLPRQGLANYLEALAVVRRLESLVADPAFHAEAIEWQRARAIDCEQRSSSQISAHSHHPAIAVMALYPAQVELLRLLIKRSPLLAATDLTIEIGLPTAFRQRECLAALISLTRSHSHRAVTFGEGPKQLTLGLTRASKRLILCGDPGTLARRAQWNGPVDHLDEADSAHERGLIARLLPHTQGAVNRTGPARMREGSSV